MIEYCPRAIENGGGPNSRFKPPMNGEMTWIDNVRCSYCGSVSPDAFLAAVEAGGKVTPTDKSYKAYISHVALASNAKFYFQYFNEDQMRKFIDLLNAKRVNFASPGHFYVKPFFFA